MEIPQSFPSLFVPCFKPLVFDLFFHYILIGFPFSNLYYKEISLLINRLHFQDEKNRKLRIDCPLVKDIFNFLL